MIELQVLEVELGPILIHFAQDMVAIVVVLMRKVLLNFVEGDPLRLEEKLLR